MKSSTTFAKALTLASLATLVASGCAKKADTDDRAQSTGQPTTSSSTASGMPNTPASESDSVARPVDGAPSGSAKDASAAITSFGADLFEQVAKTSGNANFAISPWSVESALGIAAAGAKGDTLAQMMSTLGFQAFADNPSGVQLAMGELNRSLDASGREVDDDGDDDGDDDDRVLRSANALWIADGMRPDLNPEFAAMIASMYGTGVQSAPFADDAEGARRTINKWVASNTDDKIKELLKSGTITSGTSMVITNAVAFDADWANEFDKKNTKNEPFHHLNGTTAEVKMMNQRLTGVNVWDGEHFSGIDLPYAGDNFSMSIVLPVAGQFEAVRAQLFADDGFATVFPGHATLAMETVDLGLPKFQFRWSGSLSDHLKALGMTDAFSGKANFSAMFANGSNAISEVVHEVYIDVDEEGTEAAAATGVVMVRTSMPTTPPVVRQMKVDRPFLFVIRDTATGTPIFMGQVLDPSAR